ncbi:MAG TPA: HAMP domain-containing sensor histidine kinase [Labilithrix sp.]|nr:HAMP domain-containing sensor histidine kinase [Labilithrix sp.]
MLADFVDGNRAEILARARLRVRTRSARPATEVELTHGLPVFLEQLSAALRRAVAKEASDHGRIEESAREHGHHLFDQGLTTAQVVHDYGDLCQVITGLAIEQSVVIAGEEFQTLNLCLDDAIAGAVTAYATHRERAISDDGAERLGVLAHEMRNVLNVAMLAFATIKQGTVAPGGSTGAMLERNLHGLQTLIDRSLADVRLEAGMQNPERVPVWELIEEVAIGAALVAKTRGLQFEVTSVAHSVIVEADRQILAAAVANLLQNALKFTRKGTKVSLRATATTTRVLIEVEDECGGLPPGHPAALLEPFTQRGLDRTGLGLGLSICAKAMRTMDGELRVTDLPGQGCIFSIALPLQPPPPTSIHAPRQTPAGTGQNARAV